MVRGGPRLENCFTNLIQSYSYRDIQYSHKKNLDGVEKKWFLMIKYFIGLFVLILITFKLPLLNFQINFELNGISFPQNVSEYLWDIKYKKSRYELKQSISHSLQNGSIYSSFSFTLPRETFIKIFHLNYIYYFTKCINNVIRPQVSLGHLKND